MTLRRSLLLALIPIGIGMAVGAPRPADAADVRLIGSGAIADADVCVRLFDSVSMRIEADPATGAAAGPIAVYLGQVAGCRDATYRVVIEQGVELGRPSRLVAEADFDDHGRAVAARVAGTTVPVIEGWVTLP